MKFQTIRQALRTALLLALVVTSAGAAAAQTATEPRREQLLNGLRILLWNRPGDAKVTIKLRVHSGAAFDLVGKSGLMALLGDALFSDPTTREYFAEELGGNVEVTSDFDRLSVTLTGDARHFERMVELLGTAVISTDLRPEVFERLREARVKMVRDLNVSPALVADRAVATRLFGDYPYGRTLFGSPETLARIVRPDLMLVRERFLNPNNSTLAIVGGVDERRAMRALKQLLGNWRKSDAIVPATFRQPEAPDARTLVVDMPGAETVEVRLAARGLARSDKDAAAAALLALAARDLWQAQQPALSKTAYFVRHEDHQLPGMFILGASVPISEAPATLSKAREVLNTLVKGGVAPEMLERVRGEAIGELSRQFERPESVADLWLDADTFQLAAADERLRQLKGVTAADLARTAARLFKDAAVASVVAGPAERLKADLGGAGKVEVLGEVAQPTAPAPVRAPIAVPIKKQ
ncbi:MAG TPA: pitrilysin family protein [Pyrinomonadaceae bacterium]|nr:pitrilysin family protein [Pyrinomonadaceae bacterium]